MPPKVMKRSMSSPCGFALALCLALLSPDAFAQGGEVPWETVAEGAIHIRVRPVPNSNIKEIWAEGHMEAEVQDIQSTLNDAENFRQFMPHVKESLPYATAVVLLGSVLLVNATAIGLRLFLRGRKKW